MSQASGHLHDDGCNRLSKLTGSAAQPCATFWYTVSEPDFQHGIVSVLATIAIVIGVTFTDTFNRHQRVQMGEAAVKERMENTLSSMTLRLNAKDMKIEVLLDANRGIRVAYEECLAVTP